MSRWRSLLGLLAALVAVAGTFACNTPSIPLPPPSPPEIREVSGAVEEPGARLWRASGEVVEPGAVVVLLRERTGRGPAARADERGSYETLPFEAAPGDLMRLWYESGGDASEVTCFGLEAGRPAAIGCPGP